ncbi:family A G protein-coupled receptor-like protein [Rhizodiscina lignyota]|uniref:Family A G protein-coupled receptor-like protein n=1 Tax=Rhizodiscina lignyota TaxID=1504668 RepID=A0A9P4IK15_9PEZI|nr:family A G protein-coupled receptor-like protein [Rhizodiscina lignyota]
MLMKTKSLLVPTSTASSHHSATPLPTVIPDLPEFQKVHHDGKTTLWVVFVIMLVASIIFTGMSWSIPISKRLYHILTTLITIIATISYFAMATGHGVTWHHIKAVEQHDHGLPDTTRDIYRQVYWARYVDWALTTPLLLLDLAFLAGMNGGTILIAIVADVTMILTGLFAAFGSETTGQKWGWYAIACIAYLVIIFQLVLNGRTASLAKGSNVSKFFISIAAFTLIVWTAYPVIWGVADGGRHISVDGEIIAYAVLDILAKPIFGIWLLVTHSRMPETNVELGGFWSQGLASEGRIRIGDDDEGA